MSIAGSLRRLLRRLKDLLRRPAGASKLPSPPPPPRPRPQRPRLPPRSPSIGARFTISIALQSGVDDALVAVLDALPRVRLLRPAAGPAISPDGADVVLLSADRRQAGAGPDPTDPAATWLTVAASTPPAPEVVPRRDDVEAFLFDDEDTRGSWERTFGDLAGRAWCFAERDGRQLHDSVGSMIDRLYPIHPLPAVRRVGVIGYNLKFFDPIATHLARIPGIDVLIDRWPVFAASPTTVTDDVIEQCDVVVAEWCGPNAVYASRVKRPGQRLVVRLHRFELDTPHWRDVEIENVDVVVTVGPYYRRQVLDVTGWPPERVITVPNLIDDLQLDRPKHHDAQFNVGLLGASSSRKRLDLAVDVIEAVRRQDPRFRLLVKTTMPADEKWAWSDPAERAYFDDLSPRLEHPSVRDAVEFVPFGPDVAAWFRTVGFILSTSADESFHLAPAEGMASRTVPLVRDWPGAVDIYGPDWVIPEPEAMAERILQLGSDPAAWSSAGERARREAVTRFGFAPVVDRWIRLLDPGSAATHR